MAKKVWDDFYEKRGRYYLVPHPYIPKLIARFKVYQVKKILDLGCGSGRHSIAFAREGFEVTGLDFSNQAIVLAKNWAKSERLTIKWVVNDLNNKIEFSYNSFDAVVAIDSLSYDSSELVNHTLDEVSRILKKGGVLFLTMPTKISNKLITHLIFSEEEILERLEDQFSILEKFKDEQGYFCVLGIVKK